jgi:RHS repeat-associated protein
VLSDHLGNVREVLASNNTVAARYDYTAYQGPVKVGTSTVEATFRTIGNYVHHAGSGLELAVYRAYDPSLGRWLSRDPLGEEGGLNLYGFVGNNPVSAVDWLGLDTLIIVHRNAPLPGTPARNASGVMHVWHNGEYQFSTPANRFGYQEGTNGIYEGNYTVKPRTDADPTSRYPNGTPAVTAKGESNPGNAGNGYRNVYIHPEVDMKGGDSRGCLTVNQQKYDQVKAFMDADQQSGQQTTLIIVNFRKTIPRAIPVK